MPRQRSRRRRTKTEIESILGEYGRSRSTLREFGALKGIPVSTLEYWLAKARRREGGHSGSLCVSSLVPVKVVRRPPDPQRAFFEVVVRGDRVLRIYPGFDPDTLAQVIGVLEGAC